MKMPSYPACLSVVASLACTSGAAQAAESPLRVLGNLVPAACIMALNEGADVEYGQIRLADSDGYTHLARKRIGLGINCPSGTHLAIRVNPLTAPATDAALARELGTTVNFVHNLYQGNAVVGAFTLRSDSASQFADGAPTSALMRNTAWARWTDVGNSTWTPQRALPHQYGWGDGLGIQPYRTIDSTLVLEGVLNRRSLLPPLEDEWALRATTLFQLVYL